MAKVPLDRLAQRVAFDPFFLAAALTAYAASDRLDDTGLLACLGCTADVLTALRLCRMPRPQPPFFGQDIDTIASRFGVRADVLAEVVRRGQTLLQFQNVAHPSTGPAAGLWAARDRPEPPLGGSA